MGCLVFLTYQTPKDAVSTLSRSLEQLGIPVPHAMQSPVADRVVRGLAALVAIYCVLHLLIGGYFSFRGWWKKREPKYPPPFTGRGKELLPSMRGNHASNQRGIIELREGDEIETREFFVPPVAFRVKAKTNSTNIRLSYVENEIIFNWEDGFDRLHIWGGPLDGRDKKGAGQIPIDEWVTIDLIYQRDSLSVDVDGCNRYREPADFSSANASFSVFTGANATVHVKSVLYGQPKDIPAQPPKKRDRAPNPDDVEYAEYGQGDPKDKSRWINVTARGAHLFAQVRYLMGVVSPVEVNHYNLGLSHDPAPGMIKALKIRLKDGACFSISDAEKLSFSSAVPCAEFFPSPYIYPPQNPDQQIVDPANPPSN